MYQRRLPVRFFFKEGQLSQLMIFFIAGIVLCKLTNLDNASKLNEASMIEFTSTIRQQFLEVQSSANHNNRIKLFYYNFSTFGFWFTNITYFSSPFFFSSKIMIVVSGDDRHLILYTLCSSSIQAIQCSWNICWSSGQRYTWRCCYRWWWKAERKMLLLVELDCQVK